MNVPFAAGQQSLPASEPPLRGGARRVPRARLRARPAELRHRRRRPEVMDRPHLDPVLAHGALEGLERLNRLGLATMHLAGPIHQEILRLGRPVTVIDLACGDGAFLRALDRRFGKQVKLMGIDRSAVAILRARRHSPGRIRFRQADLLAAEKDPRLKKLRADVVTCSLFFHHLEKEQCRRVLRLMNRLARHRLLVSDLERSWLSWWGVWLAARLVSRSPVVHYDSAVSIEAAWRPGELTALARGALPEGYRVRRRFPFRLILEADATS